MKKVIVFLLVLVVPLFCFAGIASASLADGLVAYYPFNGNANDESGNGHNGTVYGAALTTDKAGTSNSAFDFDGSGANISIADSPDLSFSPDSPATIAVWAYRTSTSSAQHLLGKRSGCSGSFSSFNYMLVLDLIYHNGLCFGGSVDLCTSGGGNDLPLNTWTHLAVVSNGGVLSLYINGVLAVSANGMLGPQNTSPLLFGAAGSCEPFGGKLDEVRLYNRALSASEIQQLYTGDIGNNGTCSQTDLDAAYQQGYADAVNALTSNGASECAYYDFFTSTLHIPCFSTGGANYWIDLGIYSGDPLLFNVSNYGAK